MLKPKQSLIKITKTNPKCILQMNCIIKNSGVHRIVSRGLYFSRGRIKRKVHLLNFNFKGGKYHLMKVIYLIFKYFYIHIKIVCNFKSFCSFMALLKSGRGWHLPTCYLWIFLTFIISTYRGFNDIMTTHLCRDIVSIFFWCNIWS